MVLFLAFTVGPVSLYCQPRFERDIRFLASRQLEGRYPGTVGDLLAQDYICHNFKSAGLAPLPAIGSYIQPFEFVRSEYRTGEMKLEAGGSTVSLIDGEDFYFDVRTKSGVVSAPCLFVGYAADSTVFTDGSMSGKTVIYVMNGSKSELPGINSESAKQWIKARRYIAPDSFVKAGAFSVLYVRDMEIERIGGGSGNLEAGIAVAHINHNTLTEIITPELLDRYVASVNAAEPLRAIPLDETVLTLDARSIRYTVATANVMGMKKGRGKDYIVIGAHHDHLGIRDCEIYPGADDNASGVAMLSELARRFGGQTTECNLLFVAFGREEGGLKGSRFFMDHLPVERSAIKAMVNLDMLGHLQNDSLYYCSFNYAGQLPYKALPQARTPLYIENRNNGISDHFVFLKDSIPTFFFNTGFTEIFHTPQDRAEYINYEGMEKISDFLVPFLMTLDKEQIERQTDYKLN